MNSLVSKCSALGFLATVSLVPFAASAGLASGGSFSCTLNADGSGNCNGTYYGARNGAGTNDQVSFAIDNWGYASFGAVYSGRSYSCTKNVTAGSLEALAWNAAISSRNYFYVTWDAAGTCQWVYIGNMSGYLSVQ